MARATARPCSSAAARLALLASCRLSRAAQASARPSGSKAADRMRRSLVPVGKRSNWESRRAIQRSARAVRLAELVKQIEEIPGDVFAKRVVIDRAQGLAEVAGFGAAAFPRVAAPLRARLVTTTVGGRIVVAAFTQILVPLAWVHRLVGRRPVRGPNSGTGRKLRRRAPISPLGTSSMYGLGPQLNRGNQKRGALFHPWIEHRGLMRRGRATAGSGVATKNGCAQ